MKSNSGIPVGVKRAHMTELAKYRRKLWDDPKLKFLFIEMTNLCNERCLHCGSRCGEESPEGMLTGEEIKAFLKKTAGQFDIRSMQLCITGGEPLLRRDFFDIMDYAHSLGYNWGMTSNGTLINKDMAIALRKAGLATISVSLDGLPETNDWFRQTEGGFERALNGVRMLRQYGALQHLQVTTVVHKRNIGELDELYELLKREGLRSWRVIAIEPIGRAKDNAELALSDDDYRKMFDFIKAHYNDEKLPVTFGCSHYLGEELEREVRRWYFLCNAGIYTASIMWNGDITACLDIERRPELVQGNIRTDDFADVWKNKFTEYRSDMRKQGPCADCRDYEFCAGGAFHTWNFDECRQNVCFKGVLF
ncbi:MAG: radical SAM protein [Oscillospiraceae bacterium]